jgi:hypothetical protein
MTNKNLEQDEIEINASILANFYESYSEKSDIPIEDFLNLNPVPDVKKIRSKTYEENFIEWAETENPVIEPFDIKDHDFNQDGPFLLRAYHGTTHNIQSFEALSHGNKEGHFGAINCFTSDFFDAQNNYAGEGMDMGVKIEKLADEIMYDPEFIELHGEENQEEAEEYARASLVGDYKQVIEVFIKTNNPFIAGGGIKKFIEFIDFEDLERKTQEKFIENSGITKEVLLNNYEKYEDELDELRWETYDEIENPLIDAIEKVSNEWDLNPADVLATISEFAYDSVSMDELEKTLRNNETISVHEDYNTNEYMQGHIISEIIRELGYDSIILMNPDERFKGMNIEPHSVHIHVFDEYNHHIKSVNNLGTFNKNDSRILFKKNNKMNETFGYFLETKNGKTFINLLENSDKKTFLHESAHFFLSSIRRMSKIGIKTAISDMHLIHSWWKESSKEIASNASQREELLITQKDVNRYLDGKHIDPKKSRIIEIECEEIFANAFENFSDYKNQGIMKILERFKSWINNMFTTASDKKILINDDIRNLFQSFSNSHNTNIINIINNIKQESFSNNIVENIKLNYRYQLDQGFYCRFVKNKRNEISLTFYNQDGKISNYNDMSGITIFNKTKIIDKISFLNGKLDTIKKSSEEIDNRFNFK